MPSAKPHYKDINPKRRRWILIGKSNQQKSPGEFKNPAWPVFCSFLYDETLLPMLNVHLSYKPTIYWRIMFWSGGHPIQFSCLKIFRSMLVAVDGCLKEVLLKGIQINLNFSCERPVIIEKKGCVTGSPVHAPKHSNSPYGQTFVWYI